MKKMLLLTAALIAALAGPALAQRPGGAVGNGSRAPEAAPQGQQAYPDRSGRVSGGDRGGFRGGDRGQRNAAPAQAAPAPAQAQAAPRDFNRGGGQPSFAQRDNGQRDFNRGGNDNRNGFRGGNNNNRGGFRGNDNGRNDFGRNDRFDGRRDNFNGRSNTNDRRYSQYYRNFNAQRRFRIGSYSRPSGYYYRRWNYGDFLPSLFWSSNYWLNNYNAYDLAPPMPGTVWVRYGEDALLIDRFTGEVIQVAYGVFW